MSVAPQNDRDATTGAFSPEDLSPITLETYLARIPKVELHLHLEGAIWPDTLFQLADRHAIVLPWRSPDQLRTCFSYPEFGSFARMFLTFVDCLRVPEDFELVARHLGRELARQNIRYAEVTWTPQLYLQRPFPLQVILDALNSGRQQARSEWGIDMAWIPDLVRSLPGPADRVLAWACSDAARAGGVVALGLGGPEKDVPTSPFYDIFRKARRAGLPANPHAGENAGPESIRESLRALKAKRLGHGVRAIEDPALLAEIAAAGVTLEICPSSNLKLGIYPSFSEHPLKQLADAGCRVTINSDDPVLFDTTLTREYEHAVKECGLTLAQLDQAILTAVASTYLEPQRQKEMASTFTREFSTLRVRLRRTELQQIDSGFAKPARNR